MKVIVLVALVITVVVTVVKEADSASTCPSRDWVRFKTSCYKRVTDVKKTKAEAKAACESLKSHLVIIETEIELTFLRRNLIERVRPEMKVDYWTSAVKTDNVWKWEGTKLTVNDKFVSIDPNLTGACAALYSRVKFLLDDVPCVFKAYYICELEDQ